jgi:hypothetical protein
MAVTEEEVGSTEVGLAKERVRGYQPEPTGERRGGGDGGKGAWTVSSSSRRQQQDQQRPRRRNNQ